MAKSLLFSLFHYIFNLTPMNVIQETVEAIDPPTMDPAKIELAIVQVVIEVNTIF